MNVERDTPLHRLLCRALTAELEEVRRDLPGQQIEQIKRLRELTGFGLRTAKDAVQGTITVEQAMEAEEARLKQEELQKRLDRDAEWFTVGCGACRVEVRRAEVRPIQRWHNALMEELPELNTLHVYRELSGAEIYDLGES